MPAASSGTKPQQQQLQQGSLRPSLQQQNEDLRASPSQQWMPCKQTSSAPKQLQQQQKGKEEVVLVMDQRGSMKLPLT
jgi:hypothetical protein